MYYNYITKKKNPNSGGIFTVDVERNPLWVSIESGRVGLASSALWLGELWGCLFVHLMCRCKYKVMRDTDLSS
jgi:hypothetical protein